MTTQYTSILKLALPVQGELSGTWGDTVNDNITSMVEEAIAGRKVINSWTANSHTLTTADGTTSESRAAMLEFTDTGSSLSGNATVVCPTASKMYIAKNAVGSSRTVTLKTSSGTGIAIPDGTTMFLFCDGTNVVEAVTNINSFNVGGTTAINAIKDEDDMSSNSATALATQQSIKAYVDSQVGSFDTLAEVLAQGNTTGSNDIAVDSAQKVQFRDTAIYINSSADGQLDIVADTEVQIATTTVDVNAAVDIAGNLSVDSGAIKLDGNYPTGTENVALGNTALDSVTSSGNYNTAIGANALTANTDGGTNTAVGSRALDANSTGGSNTAVGQGALGSNETGSNNSAFGQGALGVVTGSSNLGLGAGAGNLLTTGSNNVIIGNYDGNEGGLDIRTGSNNIVLSDGAGNIRLHIDSSGAASFNGAVTADSGVTIDNISIDGSTITVGSASDLTVDAVGNIILDSDSGFIKFKDAGTEIGSISLSGSNIAISSAVQDEDIIFKGNDGGATIDALLLDMSAAGAATFNGNLTVNGADVTITSNIIHSGDTNTYFGFPSDDTFRIVTSGSEALRVDSSGRVGIGTSTPEHLLHIEGTSDSLFRLTRTGVRSYRQYINSSGNFVIRDLSGTPADRVIIDTSGNLLVGTTETDIGFTDSGAGFSVSPLGAVQVARSSTNELLYLNKLDNDGDIIRFSKDGTEVGSFGTHLSRIHISAGDAGLFVDGGGTPAIWPWKSTATTTGDADAEVGLGDSSNRFKDLYLSGTAYAASVGIGSSTLSGLLQVTGADTVEGDAKGQIVIKDSAAFNASPTMGIIFQGEHTSGSQAYMASIFGAKENTTDGNYAGFLGFATRAQGSTTAERMRIDSSGKVGIGESSPTGLLHVKGDTNSNGAELYLQVNNNNTTDNLGAIHFGNNVDETLSTILSGTSGANNTSYLTFSTSAAGTLAEAMRIDSSGNVGIGGTPSSTLDVGCGAIADPTLRIDSAAGGDPVLLFDTGAASRSSFVDFRDQGTLAGSIIYSHADDHLGFSVASNNRSEAARIDSSGKLLVGDSASHTSDLLQIETPASGGGHGIQIRRNDANGDQTIGTISFGNNTDTDLARISAKTDGDGNNGDSGALLFSTQPTSGSLTERMRIRSDGHALFTLATNATGTFQDNVGEVGSGNFCLQVTNDSLGSLKPLGFRAEDIRFATGSSERMRVDSSGDLLIGKTESGFTAAGHVLFGVGSSYHIRDNGTVAYFKRLTGGGDILDFRQDSAIVGSIATYSSTIQVGQGNVYLQFANGSDTITPANGNGTANDDAIDLGSGSARFDDIFATNGTIQTSDRNEKQDIEALTDAEQRVAVAAKGLLRKFRWKSSVAKNGDDARIHFGIIAQDLQAAFEAEGLDAGRYAMFINSTWTDEETGEERSRMGVRYSELLAFIIAAI